MNGLFHTQIKKAIILLENKLPAKMGDILIKIQDDDIIVYGKSQYNNIININKQIALNELKEIKEIFNEIIKNSKEFRCFIGNKNIKYFLVMDIDGKMFEEICKEDNGKIEWLTNI